MIFHFAAVVLIGMAVPAAAPDAPADGEAPNPIYLRFEAEADTVHSMAVRVDSSAGDAKTYDRAMADMDGDGKFEQLLETKSTRPAAEGLLNLTLDFTLGGKEWRVDLSGSATDPFSRPVYVNWTGLGGDIYAWFINGKAKPCPTAAEAVDAAPFRLGPPFRYQVRTTTQGPKALVCVGLVDGNGSTMRLAGGSRNGPLAEEERNITMTLSQDGEERSTVTAEYG